MQVNTFVLFVMWSSILIQIDTHRPLFAQLSFYQSFIPTLNLDRQIHEILPHRDLISVDDIDRCHDGWLNQVEVNIFKPSITAFQLVLNYYRSQPHKNITLQSIKSLLESAKTIAHHVRNCVRHNKGYKLGFTSMSDMTVQEFRKFMGFGWPQTSRNTKYASFGSSRRIDPLCYPPRWFQAPSEVNWRNRSAVTGVRYQSQCASCWVFATVAALESAYLKTYRKRLDLSEQQVVDCAKRQDQCGSGTSYLSLQYIYTRGVSSEASYPYKGVYQGCPSQLPAPTAAMRQYCIRGRNWYGYNDHTASEALTDTEMQRALAYFGPVSVCLNGNRLQHYKSGVLDDPYCDAQITHMVLLVGYTKRAWILKNSWGVHWGNNGYFQLVRGKNMCGINFEIAYPIMWD